MRDYLKVARWEIKKNITTKMFLIMTFIFPLFILLIGGVAGYFGSQDSARGISIGIIDKTEVLFSEVENNLNQMDSKAVKIALNREDEIEKIIHERDLDGILIIPENVFSGNEAYFYAQDLQNIGKNQIQYALNTPVINKRLKMADLPASEVLNLTKEVDIKPRFFKEEGGVMGMIMPMGLAMFMVLASIFSGSALMQGIIKEKNNRVVESLFSSISAKSLMYGKILGYGVLGLLQIVLWIAAGLVAGIYFFDFSLQPLLKIKSLYMLIYFILGFTMVAGLNAVAGASSRGSQSGSNTSMSNYIAVIPAVPLWFMAILVNNPDGIFAKVLTYIPFFTPTTMLLRMGISSPDIIEIWGTLLLILVFDIIIVKLAGKVFRIGMLMYGKDISIGEIIKWSRM